MELAKRKLKIVVVGESLVGKKHLCSAFVGEETSANKQAVFSVLGYSYSGNITVDDEEYELEINVPNSNDDKLRPLNYPMTDCFIICYSAADKKSCKNVKQRWIPEVKHFCPETPSILVATQIDKQTLASKSEEMDYTLGIEEFLECSAFEKINVNKVFEAAVRVASTHRRSNANRHGKRNVPEKYK